MLLEDNDWRSRTGMLIGDEGLEILEKAHVLVVGLGGVGAAAAEMLCRAGVGEMTINDSDSFSESNLNRQIPALHSTLNKPKAEVMAARLRDINPNIKLHVLAQYLKDEATLELLKAARYDYVVDAIDTLSPKAYLLFHCIDLQLPVVSAMGSGAKLDPGMIKVADLSQSTHCTFAFDVRKRLRRLGVERGITAVFSTEGIIKHAFVHQEGMKNKKSQVGSISYMPAIFGCYCASVVIRDLLQKENGR